MSASARPASDHLKPPDVSVPHDDFATMAMEEAPLDELLDMARARYDVRFEPLTVGGLTLEFLQIADMEALVDRLTREAGDGPVELPFWARIWPTSILLSYFLRRLDPERGPGAPRTMLEIGAGVGVCGLYAAARGFDVTMTDIHPDALLFCRINILENGLAARARVRRADFSVDRLGTRFDCIVGSEILDMEGLHRPLVKFLTSHLAFHPEAEVLLARNYHVNASPFLRRADREFHVSEKTLGYKETSRDGEATAGERQLAVITRMRARKHA